MRVESAVAALFPLRSQDIHVEEYGYGRVGRREGDVQAFGQSGDGHNGLTEKDIGDAPNRRVPASASSFQTALPSFSYVPKVAQQLHRMAT